jgi:hypothetical protein
MTFFRNLAPSSSFLSAARVRPRRWWAAIAVLFGALGAFAAYQATRPPATKPASLAAMLPQGALLTIETPDFAGLLRDWNASPEQRGWLKSENYGVFANSHLFGRLNDARAEFEAAANATPERDNAFDGDFLRQVAGGESAFAWYDVNSLEFLYITRVSEAQAGKISLLKQRAGWTARQSAGLTFYLRTGGGSADSAVGKARTVGFAVVPDAGGDLLVLGTREDLIANALGLIRPEKGVFSVVNEGWYTEVSAAQTPHFVTTLHMVLNLERLVKLPAFSSYWIQENGAEIGKYRSAVVDLVREPKAFREERTLIPKSGEDAVSTEVDLGALVGLLPADGVYRAMAGPEVKDAVAMLDEKMLGRPREEALLATNAPDPELRVRGAGSAADLETRIDAAPLVLAGASSEVLRGLLQAAAPDAVVSYTSARMPAEEGGVWVAIHNAVLLHASEPWRVEAVQAALQQSLRGSLTAAGLGLEFQAETAGGQTIYALGGPKPMWFAVRGGLWVLADDRALLVGILDHPAVAAGVPATTLAGFNHSAQRAPFARLTGLIDGTNHGAEAAATPAYFSRNLGSLSDSFAALGSEQFTERRDGSNVRQTVVYAWR